MSATLNHVGLPRDERRRGVRPPLRKPPHDHTRSALTLNGGRGPAKPVHAELYR